MNKLSACYSNSSHLVLCEKVKEILFTMRQVIGRRIILLACVQQVEVVRWADKALRRHTKKQNNLCAYSGGPALVRRAIKQKLVKMGQKRMKTSKYFTLIGLKNLGKSLDLQ